MLFLLGAKQNLQTIHTLTVPYTTGAPLTTQELKRGYQTLLQETQPSVPRAQGASPTYVSDLATVTKLYDVFTAHSSLDDTQYDIRLCNSEGRSHEVLKWTEQVAQQLGELHTPFSWLFNLAIDSVFYAASTNATGGSTSNAVGVLWVNPSENWAERDMQEFLVHELDHNLLFLHEWRYGLFRNYSRMADPSAYAKSAIRANMRPLDKAFHSAIVAVDVLLLRETVIGHGSGHVLHPPTEKLIPKIIDCAESIRELDLRENLLTDDARLLLDRCHDQVLALR